MRVEFNVNIFEYMYPEIFFFTGFLFYFIYNLNSFTIVKVLSYRYDFLNFKNYKLSNFLVSPFAVFFGFVKNNVLGSQRIREVFFQIFEKNSLIYISLLSLLTMILYIIQLIWQFDFLSNDRGDGITFSILNFTFLIDCFSICFKIFITFMAFMFFLLVKHVSYFWKFYNADFGFFVFMAVFSMLFLVSCGDFFIMYMALEVQTLSYVLLASYQMGRLRSIESGFKYFIYSAFFSVFFLMSIAFIYFVFGTVSFLDLRALVLGGFSVSFLNYIFVLSLLFILSLFFFKLGVFPYHYWMADIYEGSNLLVTAFFAILSKIGLLAVYIRVLATIFYGCDFGVLSYFFYMAILSMVFGVLLAYNQTNVKRFLAYTSVSNMGVVLASCSLLDSVSVSGGIFFFVAYVFSLIGLFVFLLGIVSKDTLILNNGKFVDAYYADLSDVSFFKTFDDFKGLFRQSPEYAIALLLILLNLSGLPPMIFFYAKYLVYIVLSGSDLYSIIFPYFLINMVSAYYYLRIIKNMFLDRQVESKLYFFYSRTLSVIFYCSAVLIFCCLFFYIPLLVYLFDFIEHLVFKLAV